MSPPKAVDKATPIQPTEEEALNGWTAETLTAYRADAERRAKGVIYFEKGYREPVMAQRQNSGYSRMRWRG